MQRLIFESSLFALHRRDKAQCGNKAFYRLKNNLPRLYPTLILLIFAGLLFARHASAESICQSDSSRYNVNMQTVIVPADAQPGDILKVATNTVNITCGAGARNQQVSSVSNPGWDSSGMTVTVDGVICRVLDKGMGISDLGLGIVWTNYNSAAGTWGCMTSLFPGLDGARLRRGLQYNGTAAITDKLYIVKTHSESDYGKSGQIEQSIAVSESDQDDNLMGELYDIDFHGSVQISTGGCTINSQTSVDMGTVSTASFHGVGSMGPTVPFAITLTNCEGSAANVRVHVEPNYGYADLNNSVIALSQEENSAAGVGIRLLLDGKKINPDVDSIKVPFQQGTTLIPFTANYYQVAESIKAGRADSTAIFYIYYE
ncbi:fimbrial protein [Kalamiella sp. sgz302252]|uniref:fimbrial protein n=1 Tax=Pantoea sp. sgz302252 TaxID=3341827 RepID=UPI0036D3E9D3